MTFYYSDDEINRFAEDVIRVVGKDPEEYRDPEELSELLYNMGKSADPAGEPDHPDWLVWETSDHFRDLSPEDREWVRRAVMEKLGPPRDEKFIGRWKQLRPF